MSVMVQRFFATQSGGGIGESAHPNGSYKLTGPLGARKDPHERATKANHIGYREWLDQIVISLANIRVTGRATFEAARAYPPPGAPP